jgi:hypothetical protein
VSVCCAQAPTDSLAVNKTIIYYNKAIGEQSRLYNGSEYPLPDPNITGNAFFQDNSNLRPGAVMYDGVYYTNVPIAYDLYRDVVVALLYNGFSKYSLVSDKVSDFYLADHHFIRIKADPLAVNGKLKPGFYDQIYGGKTTILVKRSKTIQTSSSGEKKIETFFQPSTDYYIKKDGSYYKFSGKGAMLNILKDQKKQLQQYLKDNQIRFKDNVELSMQKIADYYDHLTK